MREGCCGKKEDGNEEKSLLTMTELFVRNGNNLFI